MSNHEPTLAAFASRLRPLMEQQRALAADLREIMKHMRDCGLEGGILKQWLAAIIDADDGKDAKLKRLVSKTQDAAIYGDMLGYPIDGFGETKRFVVKEDPTHDPETGEITEHRPVEEIAADIAVMAVTSPKSAAAILAVVEAVTEPERPKPHMPSPVERDPMWEFEHRGMIDAASGQHRVPTDLAGEHLAAWQKGHDKKMAAIRERAA